MSAAIIVVAAAVVAWIAIRAVCGWSGAPYNVRELFRSRHTGVYQAAFSVLVVWVGVGPALVGGLVVRRPGLAKLIGLWSAILGLASWMLLRFSVTLESLHDILGSPTLGWPGDWELLCRFIALQSVVSIPLIVGAIAAGAACMSGVGAGIKRGLAAAAWALPWLALAWAAVIPWANTDNLTELIRNKPYWWVGPVWLSGGVLILGLHASLAGHALSRRARSAGAAFIVAAVAAPLVVAGVWAAVYMGLDPAVSKYGRTFPALRFLLAPDRSAALSWTALFVRFCGVWAAGTAMLACGSAAGLLLWRIDRRGQRMADEAPPQAEPEPRHPGRAMAVLTIAYVGLLFYGSLVPFTFQRVSAGAAWDEFWHSSMLVQARWGQSDVVINIFMGVPLAFFALGAWTREGRRDRLWVRGPVVIVGCVLVSLCLEFVQLFTADRVASIHDLIAQFIGAVLGLVAWVVSGPAMCRWARLQIARAGRASAVRRTLWAYAALLALLSAWPLIPTISASQIMRRYDRGMITLVPFADLANTELHSLVTQVLLFVPLGILAGLTGKGDVGKIARALLVGLCVALALEAAQVFLIGRYASATDVVMGAAGALLGGLVALAITPGVSNEGDRTRR